MLNLPNVVASGSYCESSSLVLVREQTGKTEVNRKLCSLAVLLFRCSDVTENLAGVYSVHILKHSRYHNQFLHLLMFFLYQVLPLRRVSACPSNPMCSGSICYTRSNKEIERDRERQKEREDTGMRECTAEQYRLLSQLLCSYNLFVSCSV